MTQVVILLFTLAAAPAGVGQVVSGPGLRAGQPLAAGQVLRAPATGGPVTLLTTGGCLVRLTPGSQVKLTPSKAKTRCSLVHVLKGRARLLAPKGKTAAPSLMVKLGKHRLSLTGEALARNDGVTGVCVNRGTARLNVARAPAPAAAPATTPAPGPGTTTTPAPPKAPSVAQKGQCLWLSAKGTTLSGYSEASAEKDCKATASDYGYGAPAVTLKVDLEKELAGLTASLHRGSGGGSDVEGGGQSMCLETGSEGSAADLGSSAVEVTKPPPPTQLRLILTLERRRP